MGTHDPDHSNADHICNENLRPEHLELDRSDESKNQSHETADEGNNGQGLDTALLKEKDQVRAAKGSFSHQEANEGEGCLSKEVDHVEGRTPEDDGFPSDKGKKRLLLRLLACPFSFRDSRSQSKQPLRPFRKAFVIQFDFVLGTQILYSDQEGESPLSHSARSAVLKKKDAGASSIRSVFGFPLPRGDSFRESTCRKMSEGGSQHGVGLR